jgi:hypothetical protein
MGLTKIVTDRQKNPHLNPSKEVGFPCWLILGSSSLTGDNGIH